MKTLKLEVYGRVQGVNFRRNVKDFADEIGLKGSVRNLDDGGVEVVVQGAEDEVRKVISFVRKNPGFSKVENVFIDEMDDAKNYNDFLILRNENFFADQSKSFRNLGKRFLKL